VDKKNIRRTDCLSAASGIHCEGLIYIDG